MNCPKCKSIIKDGERICRVCGWSADDANSIISWSYIQKRRSSKLIAISEVLASLIFIPLLILIISVIWETKFGGWQGFIDNWLIVLLYTIIGVIIVGGSVLRSDRFKEHHYIYKIIKNGIKIIEFGKEIFYKWNDIEYFNFYSDYLPRVRKSDVTNPQNKIYIFFKQNKTIKKAAIYFPASTTQIDKIINIFKKNVKHNAPYSEKPGLDPHFIKSLVTVLIIIAIAIIGTLIIYFTIGPI